jgi:hypothetical protein
LVYGGGSLSEVSSSAVCPASPLAAAVASSVAASVVAASVVAAAAAGAGGSLSSSGPTAGLVGTSHCVTMVLHSTAQNIAQHSTAQHSTAQHNSSDPVVAVVVSTREKSTHTKLSERGPSAASAGGSSGALFVDVVPAVVLMAPLAVPVRGQARSGLVRLAVVRNRCMRIRKHVSLFECFPYVCPEPVLAK